MARNILVVEDDNNISDLIRMYLEKEGFEVRIAADGGKAMQAIYDYTQQETENAGALKAALLAADHELLWAPAPAAKKYGSWDQVLHDMAIVYADEPYILSVFTNWGSADVDFPPEGVEMMQQLGHLAAQAMGADD